jgi:hypothetical protein
MEGIPQEVVIVGGVLLLGLAVVIVARYAKQILAFFLIVGGLLLVGVIAWAMLQKPSTPASTEGSGAGGALHDVADIARLFTKSEPEPSSAPTYSAPSGGGFCTGVLVALLAGVMGVAGYFWIRWRLAENSSIAEQLLPSNTRRKKRRKVQDPTPVVYVIQQGQDLDALPWELERWDENEFTQF